MDKKSITDSVKKQVLKEQLVYNLNNFPLSIQERTAIKNAVKDLKIILIFFLFINSVHSFYA